MVGAAWALAVLVYASGTAEALHHHDVTGGQVWAGLALFLVAWPVHVAAMMLPSSLPMVALFDRVAAGQPRYSRIRAAFLSGYLARAVVRRSDIPDRRLTDDLEAVLPRGPVVLVTGGNGGLGRDIALGLRNSGATVAITGRDASTYSMFGPPAYANYVAAKTGVLGLTRALAVELGAHGMPTPSFPAGSRPPHPGAPATEWGERIRRKTPVARWGAGEDLVGTAVFLASRASDFVTGVALPVDGGYAVADRLLPE